MPMEIAFQNSTYSRANIVRGTTSKDVNHDICTINDATKCMNNDILFDKCLDHFIVCVKKKGGNMSLDNVLIMDGHVTRTLVM